ncbi:MAG: PBP1A family penicillin-binding protein [Alphaproteobacteria bacterium]|nr:MAG: PBP1A family penicillin-binding protein [Alphaproteobacteria bacterium]
MKKRPSRKPDNAGKPLKAEQPIRQKSTTAETTAPKKTLLRRIVYAFAVAGVWGFILGVVALFYLALDMPNLDSPPLPGAGDPAVIVKAENGATLVRNGPIYGDWIAYQETPEALVRALLAVEDRHFFDHAGIDVRGLGRAVVTNISAGGVRAGGSTITQQLAKNLFLSSSRTLKRKAQELLLAFWLEQKFTKQQILTLYLNRVYFGGGAYGIDAASRKFYGHSARTLSVAESALLAGLVKSPSRLAPHINPEGAWARAQVVLDTMVEAGNLTAAAAEKVKRQPPRIVGAVAGRDVRFFTDWVTSEAYRLVPEASGKSLIVYTTLDPATQSAAALALERGLGKEGSTHHVSEGAIVALDNDGAVRAMVGGADYARTQFNRAVQAVRQPGSAFKLFSYLAGLEAGVKPSDRYEDTAIMIDGWSPKNYDNQFHGEMTAREAFARSINTIAVQVSEQAGRDKVAAMAHRLGISTPVQPLASLPLGTEEVRLTDLAGAYAAVANGGHRVEPYSIIELTTLEGQVLYRRTPMPPIAVLARPIVDEMADMLTSVVEWGSGKNAKIDRPAAGKTGTSQDSRDAVFVGFTSDLTAAVWVGNDDGSPMKYVTGGGLPARVWSDFMIEAHAGHPVRPLLADAGMYRDAAELAGRVEEEAKPKKKRGFFGRLFGSD